MGCPQKKDSTASFHNSVHVVILQLRAVVAASRIQVSLPSNVHKRILYNMWEVIKLVQSSPIIGHDLTQFMAGLSKVCGREQLGMASPGFMEDSSYIPEPKCIKHEASP